MKLPFLKHHLVSVVALSLALPALAYADDSASTRTVGPQPDGSIVASDNQLLTPAGTLVQLGSPVRAKQVVVNPNKKTNTAAALLMGASSPVIVFNTQTGAIVQKYIPTVAGKNNTTGSFTGITYSADGSQLFFSQDNNYVSVANVDPTAGTLTQAYNVTLPPPPANPNLYNSSSANAGGVAVTADGATAVVALNANNTVGIIDTKSQTLTSQISVGNAPNHVLINGNYAYVSNEGGRPATQDDFTNLSDGTPIVADPTDAFATTGTISVIDLKKGLQVATIDVGLHPAGMTLSNGKLYVANSYSDTISVIDTKTNKVVQTIDVGVPVKGGAFGAGVNDITVVDSTAYVTLGQSNAIAVVRLGPQKEFSNGQGDPQGKGFDNNDKKDVIGYIPTAYFPTSITYDPVNKQLVVADDKGVGAQGSKTSSHGVTGYNTHRDTAVINLIPLPISANQLKDMTNQVISNNHWDSDNIAAANQDQGDGNEHGFDKNAKPVAIPAHIGEPSLIKHVFLIIKENRTYDQILGDLPQGNGDPSLAVFAANTPNQHALVQRFPLLDNVYAPSRQSADGHPWIVESGSFYSNDILSPDWIRSYPGGNSDDALTYTQAGFLWSGAAKQGLTVKLYGEWSVGPTVAKKPGGGSYTWADFYNTALFKEGKGGSMIVPDNADSESTDIPSASAILDPHYPSFNLTIPDQYRVDYWLPIFQNQVATNTVPNLTIMWLPDDHTNGTTAGYPLAANYQADNDLALGRIVEAISNSNVWGSSAIFVEEDDSQDGVDHVDGHRQPVYVISPYTVAPQAPNVGKVIHTTYTQENINRTIENILGLQPLTQFDLVASPMFDVFQNTPNLAPFTHLPATTPLNIGPGNTVIAGTGPNPTYGENLKAKKSVRYAKTMSPIEKAWMLASNKMTKGKETKADAVDEDFLNHAIWYSATNWTRPYPGESKIQTPGRFVKAAASKGDRDDD